MRNFIFKRELECLFYKYNIGEKERIEVKTFLLKDKANMAVTDKSKLFFLNNLEDGWMDRIKEKVPVDDFVPELSDLLNLDDDLHIPKSLKTKIQNGEKIAVFVGAGISKLLGYPLWTELGDAAIKFLCEQREIDEFQYSRIQNDVKDPKQKLSILETFFSKESDKGRTFYKNHFQELKDKKPNPYDILVSPVFNWIKVTSNIDLAFGAALASLLTQRNEKRGDETPKIFSPGEVSVSNDIRIDSLSMDNVYHLHGTIMDPGSITFTTNDYINKYYDRNSSTNSFLNSLFKNYTVVFMGYGLEELQILESVVNVGSRKSTEPQHYALFGSYLNEMNFFSIRKRYFKESLNIELLHYYLDFTMYHRIIEILQNWKKELESESNFHQKISFVDDVLNGANQ